ncbi:MAG: SEL1-like repeat protein, partial [Kiritimatiellae bacterium]|nr:SEL1-like repeat protein [Kiritimatiellia bacterium]
MGQQVLKVDFRPWGNAGARQHSCRAEESGARSQNPVINAAKQGDPEAQYNLGRCYKEGRGFAKNEAVAVNWFRKAAE